MAICLWCLIHIFTDSSLLSFFFSRLHSRQAPSLAPEVMSDGNQEAVSEPQFEVRLFSEFGWPPKEGVPVTHPSCHRKHHGASILRRAGGNQCRRKRISWADESGPVVGSRAEPLPTRRLRSSTRDRGAVGKPESTDGSYERRRTTRRKPEGAIERRSQPRRRVATTQPRPADEKTNMPDEDAEMMRCLEDFLRVLQLN